MLIRILRHLLSIAVLPFMVITVVPRWLATQYDIGFIAPVGAINTAIVALGVLSFLCGGLLAGSSVLMFFLHGDGTLAPWDPPKKFVAVGPYRYVRNPMISGVFFVLLAQTLVLRSPIHAVWTGFFALLNLTFIPLVEEPQLRRRFGASFDDYCRHVNRFVPRRSAYVGPSFGSGISFSSGITSTAGLKPGPTYDVATLVAVVPASGRSSRFGSDKRKALIDGTPMLERTVATLKAAGADPVFVVDDNPDPDRGMFSTIRLGLERALEADATVILVQPADMPFVRPETIATIAAECQRTGRAVCPRVNGKRGHPLAFPRDIARQLLAVDPSTPLNEAFAAIGLVRLELDVDDVGILRDVDVPSDLTH